ncbi:MAG: NAD-dependent epimerase/dehydratase family protein [Planctomycetota bacterium]
MSRSALVTGAGGFVGRWLVAALREEGWRVYTLDRHRPADFRGDLAGMPLGGLPRVAAVFHLAGWARPAASGQAAEETYRANALGTARLARHARAERFILASSCQIYGFPSRRVDETAPPRPPNPYAASKLCGEALARAARPDAIILRPFNHTGPGQSHEYLGPGLARQVARAEAGQAPPVLHVQDLAPRRDFFDVRDMARAYLRAAERARPGETYNVTSEQTFSVEEIVEIFRGLSRIRLQVRGRRREATLLSGDASRFRHATGWEPRIPFRKTLADLLDYERARLPGYPPSSPSRR